MTLKNLLEYYRYELLEYASKKCVLEQIINNGKTCTAEAQCPLQARLKDIGENTSWCPLGMYGLKVK